MTPPKEAPAPTPMLDAAAIGASVQGKGLYAKIAAVQHHVGNVEKTGKVSFGTTKFQHMQEHGLIEVLRPLWRAVGIAVIPGASDREAWDIKGNAYIIDLAIVIADVEKAPEGLPQSLTFHFPNVGNDNADKGFNKAYTGAVKYGLQKLFLVPTEGIDDNDQIATNKATATKPAVGAPADAAPQQAIDEVRKTLLEAHNEGTLPGGESQAHIAEKYGRKLQELTSPELQEVASWAMNRIADAEAARG